MRRKEIFFKQLNFIIGVALLITFVAGTEVPLPLRSETRLYEEGGCEGEIENEMIIKQDTNEVNVIYFVGPPNSPFGKGIEDGEITLSEFKLYWDSLNSLGFWSLKGEYSGKSNITGEIGGEISISFETTESLKMTKVVQFSVPKNCPPEFKRVYQLIGSKRNYAQNQPTLNNLLKYGEIRNSWYANADIGRIQDPKYLDTLMVLLFTEDKYADGIIRALGNIGDEKAIPVLCKYLEIIDPSGNEGSIENILNSIVSIEKGKSSHILKKLINNKYSQITRTKASIMLIFFKDYSGIPVLVNHIKGQKLSFADGLMLRHFSYKNKHLINALIKELESEAKNKEPDDKIIVELIKGLSKITDQDFPYNPSGSLTAKKETINKWINWWKENKDTFK